MSYWLPNFIWLLAYQVNDLAGAARYLEQALSLSRRLGEVGSLDAYAVLVRLQQVQGDTAGARESLRQARRFVRQFSSMGDLVVDVLQIRLELAEGNLAAALAWAETYRQEQVAAPAPYFPHELAELALARVLLAQGRADPAGPALAEAGRRLAGLRPQADRLGRPGSLIEILLLQALVIAPGTVKKHVNNIFGKLGAHRRTEALARARELGLLG